MRTLAPLAVIALVSLGEAGCAVRPSEINREPVLTPVGAGMVPAAVTPHLGDRYATPPTAFNSLYHDGESLYRDPRAMKAGDILTVNIQINDKATLGDNTARGTDNEITNNAGLGLNATQPQLTTTFTSTSKSSSNGTGTIDRSEKIQVNVAAVVTQVMPDGNLLVSGSQEVRVNYEVRQVYIAGIVRPRDISKDNTISYDKIAEARISYGGRGRLSEAQQPAWGQQVYDILKPF